MAEVMSDSEDETAVVTCCMAAADALVRAADDGWGSTGRTLLSSRDMHRGAISWFVTCLSPSPIHIRSHVRCLFRVRMRLFHAIERELPLVDPLLLSTS